MFSCSNCLKGTVSRDCRPLFIWLALRNTVKLFRQNYLPTHLRRISRNHFSLFIKCPIVFLKISGRKSCDTFSFIWQTLVRQSHKLEWASQNYTYVYAMYAYHIQISPCSCYCFFKCCPDIKSNS